MTLDDLNQLPAIDAEHVFMQCCTSSAWVNNMINARPFLNLSTLENSADIAWQDLTENDYLNAFEGHPKIGDVNSLRAKYANTKELASGEQSSVNHATEQVLIDLSLGNDEYFNKFGFIFIVCATGKSAMQMLALLQARLPNNRATELINAAEEQRKIFHIRLSKLLGEQA